MEKQDSVALATKLIEAADRLDEAVEYMRKNLNFKERAPLTRAIGDIFGIMATEIKSRLVKANPELHDVLFRGLPKDTPDNLLQMSQYRDSGKGGE